jgi:hypothetical protein
VKFGSYKNWRLNGEFVFNPDDDRERFNGLEPGDFAIFDFGGVQLFPTTAKMVLISRTEESDRRLHELISQCFTSTRSMEPITRAQLSSWINEARALQTHPIYELVLEDALEDVVLGGTRGPEEIQRHRPNRRVTRAELQRAKDNADYIGRLGEEYINSHLAALKDERLIDEYAWVSDLNAIAPFDFEVVRGGDLVEHVDAKTTSGSFDRPIHLSLAELNEAATGTSVYRIYRIYSISDSGARLRISDNISTWAQLILQTLRKLPAGVRADTISFYPNLLVFGPEIALEPPNKYDNDV